MWKTINGLGKQVVWYSEEECQTALEQLSTDKKEAQLQAELVRTLYTIKDAEIKKLEKALIEIKNIAKKHIGWCNKCEIKQILQKASEVLDD